MYRYNPLSMDSRIFIAQSDREINDCFPVFKVLRPHVSEEAFLPQVRRQQAQGYTILALRDDGVVKRVIAHARDQGCAGVHLDTGYARHDAHRLYLRKGFRFDCHHLALDLSRTA